MMTIPHSRLVIRLFWLVSAMAFGAVLWVASPRGLGLNPDSVAYLKATQGLFLGQGFSYFSVQWPPLLSSTIYLFSQLFEQDFVRGARLLNALLYGCTFLLTGALIRRITVGKQVWLISYVFAGLLCLHPVMTYSFFYVLSESLFLPLVLANLILLLSYCERKNGLSLNFSLALCLLSCLASSTRYAGLTLVALNVLVIWVISEKDSLLKKLLHFGMQIIPTLILVLIWRNHVGVGDTETNQRPLVWHPVTFQNIYDGLGTLGGWILPALPLNESTWIRQVGAWVGSVFVLSLVGFALRGLLQLYKIRASQADRFSERARLSEYAFAILPIFGAGYLLFLVVMRSLFDPNIVFDSRTLSPIFLPTLALVLACCHHIATYRVRVTCLILSSLLLIWPLNQLRPRLLISYFNGIELNDKTRLNSNVLRFLRTCPKSALIYADRPWDFNLEFQSMVHWLPTYYFYGSGLPDPLFQSKLQNLPKVAELIVVEDTQSIYVNALDQLSSFRRVYAAADGLVWQNATAANLSCSAK